MRQYQSPDLSRTLICTAQGAQVKIEVNTIIRGTLFEASAMPTCSSVEKHFRQFVEMKIAHIGDLYGGKICAALDRQHPRDLFDIKLLLENDGLTAEIKKGFMFYLLSHNRPMSELINPLILDMRQTFASEFEDMASSFFSYEDFEDTRNLLLQKLGVIFTDGEKQFLVSFKKGKPMWELSGLPKIEHYPAVRWKLHNIHKMTPQKKDEAVEKLVKVL